MEPVFLSLDEVQEIHEQQIERYGGSSGLRDGGALESATVTPQATFGGEFLHTSTPAMAAAYLFHLCQNHPFLDGNKRVGANAAITFLLINQWEPAFDEEELVDLVFVRYYRWTEEAAADRDLRIPLQASRRHLKSGRETEVASRECESCFMQPPCIGDLSSPKIGDVQQRKKLSTTIGASNYAYLLSMVKAGKAESVGQAVDKAVETVRRLDNRATLERQTAAYFKGLTVKAAAEETDLEDALSNASQEMDFDQP